MEAICKTEIGLLGDTYSNILQDGQIGTVRNLAEKMVTKYDELDSLPGLDLKIVIIDPTKTKQ